MALRGEARLCRAVGAPGRLVAQTPPLYFFGVSDEEGSTGHKLGIGAGILALLGGIGRFADDCGRGAAKVGGATVHSDDALRGVGKLGGASDDLTRGAAHSDALLGGGKLPATLEGVDTLHVGRGPFTKVTGEVAPGAGTSIEEAFVEFGVNLALETISWELPEPPAADLAVAVRPPEVLVTDGNPAHAAAFDRMAVPGALLTIVGSADERSAIAFGDTRLSDAQVHQRCLSLGTRCAVLICRAGKDQGCLSLGAGLGRTAKLRVPLDGSPETRYASLIAALLERRNGVGARAIELSRVDVRGGKIIRSEQNFGRPR